MIALLSILLSCQTGRVGSLAGEPGPARDSGAAPTGDEADADTDSDADTDADADADTVEHLGAADTGAAPDEDTWPKACADLYDPDLLPSFDLTFTDEAWSGLRAACSAGSQEYFPVDFSYDGETVAAMARLKGNWSWSCEKLQFIISFNEEDPEGRFHGQRKLMLDAPWYDRTLMHERIAFPLFERLGLPYSCVNNARLTVNGDYYGIYANIERIDHEYLERHFEESEGNLYQGGTELKTNEDIGDTSNLLALQAATTVEELELLMDLDQAVAEWAAEAMLPAMDNYWAGVEINYYLYDHPSRGFVYLPYDLDLSFGDGAYSDGSLVWPNAVHSDPITYEHYGWRKEALFLLVLADPAWCARFVEELTLARAAYSPEEMSAQVAHWDAQIAASVAEDTRKPYPTGAHTTAVTSLQSFFGERAAVVDAWLAEGGHCPSPE
jgi:hypothetical protein